MSYMLSLEQQKKKFLSLKAKNSIKAGSTAFLISALWFNKWKLAVGIDSGSNPSNESSEEKKSDEKIKIPPIDNRILIYDNGRLKPTLTEKYDFIILSPPLWKLLYEWYPGRGPEIQVEIIDHPIFHVPVPILSELTFSVFYKPNIGEIIEGNIKDANNDSTDDLKFVEVKVNKYQKIRDIKENVCEILNIDPNKTIIRDFWNHNSLPPLQDNEYIYNKHLVDTQELLLQVKDTKSEPRPRNRLVSRTNSSMTIVNAPMYHFKPLTNGHVGLENLGNTCFFNSAVQALSHTEMLAAFFLNAKWRENINSSNRFSTNGLLTNAYAQIVNDIWKKNDIFITPKRLFDTIAEYAPRFGDHMQHDAQELMMFLLDYIHEDLNRVNKNVYIEGVEGDSSSEQVAAEAAWKRHKLTNDSIIVDLFHGQLESQLECPNCHRKKIVFDPYLCVTLPMPTERMSSVRYFYVPYDLKKRRCLVKIYVISTTEEENVRMDAIKRFKIYSNEQENENQNEGDDKKDTDSNDENINIQPIGPDDHRNCLIIDKDDLISNFGVKLPPALRKAEYIVFEVPDDRKTYTLASVFAEFQKKGTNGIIDGPVLVEIPESVLENQEKIIEMIQNPKPKPKPKPKKKKNTKPVKKQSKKTKITTKKKEKTTKITKETNKKSLLTIQTRSSIRTRSKVSTFSPSRPVKKKEPTSQLRMETRSRERKNKQEETLKRKQKIIEEEENEEENEEEEIEEEKIEEEIEEEEIETESGIENHVLPIFDSISEDMQNAAEERFNIYWEETEFMMIDSQRKQDLAVSPTISKKLIENLQGNTEKRMFAEPVNNYDYEDVEVGKIIGSLRLISSSNNFYFFEKSEQVPYLSLSSMKVTLNPLQSRTAEGFKWQAVLPISKEINRAEDVKSSLTKCLECFSYPDKLDELNEWFCPTCRKLVRAIARLDLWSIPDNLILHLKRFVYKDGNFKKVFGKVSFPEIIDMQPYVRGPQKSENNLKYKIHAIINHIGTMNGGHYTTSAFSSSEHKWFTYNDEAVYQTSENLTYSDLPYVLFYHRMKDNDLI